MNNKLTPFHLAIPVHNLDLAREFYGDILGCNTGRTSETWIDWNFWGHQVVTHLDPNFKPKEAVNLVDAKDIGVPHFGIVMQWTDWELLKDRLQTKGIQFVLEPYIRFKGQPGEQGTFFVKDFSENRLEFKTFRNFEQLFAT